MFRLGRAAKIRKCWPNGQALLPDLAQATPEEYYEAINCPDHELYHVLWDLFETIVIEPAEVVNTNFGSHNKFRYRINPTAVTLEFVPEKSSFEKRLEPNPFRDGSDAGGIHLKLMITPEKSCLFSVALQIWGQTERLAFKKLWKLNRSIVADMLRRAKPMVSKRIGFPAMDHSAGIEEMLDHYFSVRDAENFIGLHYSFARFDETDIAQKFMTQMAFLYHCIRQICEKKECRPQQLLTRLKDFYSGHLPELPPSLPCVELAISSEKE